MFIYIYIYIYNYYFNFMACYIYKKKIVLKISDRAYVDLSLNSIDTYVIIKSIYIYIYYA